MKFGVLGTQRTVHSSEVSILWTEIGILRSLVSILGTNPGGALGYFLGGYVPPGTPNWHPVLKKFPLKLIPRSRIRPKTDTPF